jgi:hypothetical protein
MFVGFNLIIFIIFALIVFKTITTYVKNENSPVISTKAQLVKKQWHTNTQTDSNGVTTTNDTFSLKFQLDTGSDMKFTVGRRIYKEIEEDEWGTLTFQGTRFLKFQWDKGLVEK